MKAIFNTKIVAENEDYSEHNGELVEIIDEIKYKNETRYKIKFEDDTIVTNIMSTELDFDVENYLIKKEHYLKYLEAEMKVCGTSKRDLNEIAELEEEIEKLEEYVTLEME